MASASMHTRVASAGGADLADHVRESAGDPRAQVHVAIGRLRRRALERASSSRVPPAVRQVDATLVQLTWSGRHSLIMAKDGLVRQA